MQSPQKLSGMKHSMSPVMWAGVAVVIIAAGLSIGGYSMGYFSPAATPAPTPTPIPVTAYSDTGIKFSYDSSWKMVGANDFAEGKLDSAPDLTKELSVVFFGGSTFTAVKKDIKDFQANPPTGADAFQKASALFFQALAKREFTVVRNKTQDAHTAAQAATKSVCTGDDVSFSTSNPIVESRVVAKKIGKYNGYVVLPESACNQKESDFFVNAVGATSATSSFELGFNKAVDFSHLSASQQLIVDSLVLN